MILESKAILEVKSIETVTAAHRKQLQTYLRLTGCKLGYILNLGAALMKNGIIRIVNGLEECSLSFAVPAFPRETQKTIYGLPSASSAPLRETLPVLPSLLCAPARKEAFFPLCAPAREEDSPFPFPLSPPRPLRLRAKTVFLFPLRPLRPCARPIPVFRLPIDLAA